MPRKKPHQIRIRAYQVGFGDCFLVTFAYEGRTRDRHLLIDFGSTSRPKGAGPDHMKRIAESIAEECGGKLDAVVATHRHKDHVSGFATRQDGKGPGDVIRNLDPEVVIQPWTEDPDAPRDATRPTRLSDDSRAFVSALAEMHGVARAVRDEVRKLADDRELARARGISDTLRKRLEFMGETNIANRSAVENLMAMGKKRFYVSHGSDSGLERLLPGVKVHVLGPPTLEQSDTIRAQRHRDEDEFWHLQARAGRRAVRPKPVFGDAPRYDDGAEPRASRWLIQHVSKLRGSQLLEIVRILDKALNNTSVILLFEVGKERLLFPGDAQIENWLYALEGAPDSADTRKLLEKVTFYKVGHHGSLNATPKSLWRGFDHRSEADGDPRRLRTVVSTLRGKHGSTRRQTEVPRKTLVEALSRESDYASTEEEIRAAELKDGTLFVDTTIAL